MTERIPCSVLILTRNNESSLERCLRNLGRFDEVLIFDGNSTDATLDIARRFNTRIEKQYETNEPNVRINDFTAMRIKHQTAAKNDWVILLDADEEMTDALVDEIAALLPTLPQNAIVEFRRDFTYNGIICRYGLGVPYYSVRLYNRNGGAKWKADRKVHEHLLYKGHPVLRTKAAMLVPLESTAEFKAKDKKYLSMEQERLAREPYSLHRYLRWFLWREPLIMIQLSAKILSRLPFYLRRDSIPFAHDWRNVSYHWRLFWMHTRRLFQRTQSAS